MSDHVYYIWKIGSILSSVGAGECSSWVWCCSLPGASIRLSFARLLWWFTKLSSCSWTSIFVGGHTSPISHWWASKALDAGLLAYLHHHLQIPLAPCPAFWWLSDGLRWAYPTLYHNTLQSVLQLQHLENSPLQSLPEHWELNLHKCFKIFWQQERHYRHWCCVEDNVILDKNRYVKVIGKSWKGFEKLSFADVLVTSPECLSNIGKSKLDAKRNWAMSIFSFLRMPWIASFISFLCRNLMYNSKSTKH